MNAASRLSEESGHAAERALITVSVMLASIMQALDTTIANVALPRIQGELSATQDQMAWVLTSYIVAAAIMTPLSGWLATRVGRKRVFLFSVVGFTIASALCGLAQSLPEIVVARLLQGVCGAALIPMSQAVLLDTYPPDKQTRAMAFWVMGVTIGPIIGPALGGWLTEAYNWRWVFYINLPFGILSVLGILAFMPETSTRTSRFDFIGFAALSLGVGALQLMLDRGQLMDWFSATEIWIEAAVAGVAFYVFLVHMLTTRETAFVSASLFKDRNFVTGNLFIFLIGAVLYATLALLPPLLQNIMNYPVFLTGLVTAPRGVGTLLAMLVVGRLLARIDARVIIAAGFAITAWAQWQMTNFYLQMDNSLIIWSGLAQGIGIGFVFVPLSTVTFATLAPEYRNEGTALFSLVRNLGSSIGISAVAALLTRNTQMMHARLAEQVTPYGDALHLHADWSGAAGLAGLDALVTRQAAMIAYNNNFKLLMVLALCAVPAVFLLRPARAAAAQTMAVE
jgi:MFS transporter, DHA2 family, multidrug resistance protein